MLRPAARSVLAPRSNPETTVRRSLVDDANPDENERFLDEVLVPALFVAGVLLFLFPEPATSTVGVFLVGIGLATWAWDVVR